MKDSNPSPSSVERVLDTPKAKRDRYERDIQRAREEGFREGLKKGRREIIDWLENAYINNSGRPDRGSAKAEAILELARDASLHFKSVEGRRPARGRR